MLNKSDAIQFLKQNQPLPDDVNIREDIIARFDEVRIYFLENPEVE